MRIEKDGSSITLTMTSDDIMTLNQESHKHPWLSLEVEDISRETKVIVSLCMSEKMPNLVELLDSNSVYQLKSALMVYDIQEDSTHIYFDRSWFLTTMRELSEEQAPNYTLEPEPHIDRTVLKYVQ